MEKILELTLAVIVIGGTLAFGGVQPIAYSLMEVVVFVSLLLLLLKQTGKGEINVPLPIWPVLFGLWVTLEMVPLPARLVLWLSPIRGLDSGLPGGKPDNGMWETLSIYPHATMVGLIKVLAYLSGFVLAAHVFDSRKGKSILLQALILLGWFEAVYGIFQYLTGSNKIFTYTNRVGWGAGTYINHNHFAGLLELILPFVVASCFYSFQIWSGRGPRDAGRSLLVERSSAGFQCLFYLFLLVTMALADIFSRSRGGILSALFSVVFIVLLAQLKVRRKGWLLAGFSFLLCVAAYGLWIGLDPVLARFEGMREAGILGSLGRVPMWKDGLKLLRDYPIQGTGLGTFGVAFQHYQTSFLGSYVDHVHNDYLELACETGLLGAALLFLPILCLFLRMIARFLDDPQPYRQAVLLGCVGSTLGLLVHSVSDFNLQIPANALVFAVVLGIGYKVACVERREEQGVVGLR